MNVKIINAVIIPINILFFLSLYMVFNLFKFVFQLQSLLLKYINKSRLRINSKKYFNPSNRK